MQREPETTATAAATAAATAVEAAAARAATTAAGGKSSGKSDGRSDGKANPPGRISAARLGLMIGERRLLVELSEAGEIVPVPSAIVPVPLTRDWLLGVVNLRGALHTVVDLRRFTGEGATEPTKEARLLSLAPTMNFNATLLVSRMLGLRNTVTMTELPPDAAESARPAGDGPAWLGRRFSDAEGRIWQELLLSRLIATPDFLMVGR
ncbi:MAG: chemotaxis protein CheW [Lautropia sp.]